MNRQGLVQAAAVTPQHIQKGLFVMLAVIVTLLVCQQYQRWVDAHTPEPVAFHSTHTQQHFSPALAQADTRPTLQQVEGTAPEQDQPAQPHWTF
ncbi:hypothetical protein SFA35_00115 [Pseudomonas sp. HR96]|uniref:hypothetical protein n=1 Tax=Pseudomonas sp. HR96 TaxID=1027966 RepID=UPI002A74BE95|nr:hypothetical protein [Pseudomonas sp. HR96]WPO99835.1 hypothetical protein SFA35_00115 [Pseudomonas sp. HR96]